MVVKELTKMYGLWKQQIDGLVQDCNNSIAKALELLQSYRKPSK